jgi:hypothetical protein
MPAPASVPTVVVSTLVIDLSSANAIERWSWGGGHDVKSWSEEGATLFSSTLPNALLEDLLVTPSIPIPESVASLVPGRTARVTLVARSAGATEFAAAYFVEGSEAPQWTVFKNIGNEYRQYVLYVEVTGIGAPHRICVWGDSTGSNLATLLQRIEIVIEDPLDRDPRGDNAVDGVVNELRQWSYDKLYKECDVDLARVGIGWASRLRTNRPSRDDWLGREDNYVVQLLDRVQAWRGQRPPGAEVFAQSERRAVVSIPVWGRGFVQCLTDILLPSLLSEGNIPGLADHAKILVYILAPASDAAYIAAHASCERLRRHAHVEFIIVDDLLTKLVSDHPEDGRRYWLYGALHQLTLSYAKILNADIFLLNPDTIYAQDSLSGLLLLGEAGFDAVVFTSLRLKRNAASRQFREYTDEDGAIRLNGTDLANIAVEFIHPVHRRSFMYPRNHDFLARMVNLYWEVPGAIVMHAAHLQPHFISNRALARLSGLDFNTVDTRLISRMFASPEDLQRLYVLPNMRDISYFEFTPEEREWPSSRQPFPMDKFAEAWFWPACTPLNDWIFRQKTEIPLENQPLIGLRSREIMDAETASLFAAIDRARPGVAGTRIAIAGTKNGAEITE